MEPILTVVSASWNQGRYFEECLRSLEGIDPDDIEHVVVDNCSDDSTHDILNRHPKIRAIIEPDKGQSEALNKGFRAARGEWILWLNVDDYLLPSALAELCGIIRSEGSDLDMIYGHMVFVDDESRKIRTIYQPVWRHWMSEIGVYVAPSTGSLFRRKLLVENALNEDFHMIMDTEWMLRVGRSLRVRRLNREVVAFRVADNKTAEHINSGTLTSRHREERILLAKRYPTYGYRSETGKGLLFHSGLWVLRKVLRVWILADKAVCKLQNRQ
ncbi:glycosyltransferase [bacterium]|nr:glycosyltransferase [bacterium]MDB4754140.1 glycosyltransferase [Akkermansiaceae bacterium]